MEVMVGPQGKMDPGGSSWCKGRGGTLLTGLLSWLAHPAFLCYLKPPVHGWYHPQWAGPSYINHQLRKCIWAVVAHTCNPSTLEAEAGTSLSSRSTEWVLGQPGLHREALSRKTKNTKIKFKKRSTGLPTGQSREGNLFQNDASLDHVDMKPAIMVFVIGQSEDRLCLPW